MTKYSGGDITHRVPKQIIAGRHVPCPCPPRFRPLVSSTLSSRSQSRGSPTTNPPFMGLPVYSKIVFRRKCPHKAFVVRHSAVWCCLLTVLAFLYCIHIDIDNFIIFLLFFFFNCKMLRFVGYQ